MTYNEQRACWEADSGKIFKKKNCDEVIERVIETIVTEPVCLSEVLYLGINDNIENYEEILKEVVVE